MVPDAVTPISFNIWDKFHTFKKGHRIMVQVHSSWFPIFDRNPQTFTNIYRAGKSDYRTATQRIYRSSGSPSHLVLLGNALVLRQVRIAVRTVRARPW